MSHVRHHILALPHRTLSKVTHKISSCIVSSFFVFFPFQHRTAGDFRATCLADHCASIAFFLPAFVFVRTRTKKKRRMKCDVTTSKRKVGNQKDKGALKTRNKTEPRILRRVKAFFFLHRGSSKREKKPPSYSLYKCRAGASAADQIDFYLEVTKGDTFFFFYPVIREQVRSGRLGKYISLYIYIVYVYLYVYMYMP